MPRVEGVGRTCDDTTAVNEVWGAVVRRAAGDPG